MIDVQAIITLRESYIQLEKAIDKKRKRSSSLQQNPEQKGELFGKSVIVEDIIAVLTDLIVAHQKPSTTNEA